MQDAGTVGKKWLKNVRNSSAGIIFLVIAAAFGIEATNYELGQAIRMGPGFIPLLLAILLGCLGLVIAVADFAEQNQVSGQPVSWRSMVLVSASLLIFGTYVRSLGLIPCVFICAFLTSFASVRNPLLLAFLNAAALSALCWVVFKLGLEVSLPTVGPAFGSLQAL